MVCQSAHQLLLSDEFDVHYLDGKPSRVARVVHACVTHDALLVAVMNLLIHAA